MYIYICIKYIILHFNAQYNIILLYYNTIYYSLIECINAFKISKFTLLLFTNFSTAREKVLSYYIIQSYF